MPLGHLSSDEIAAAWEYVRRVVDSHEHDGWCDGLPDDVRIGVVEDGNVVFSFPAAGWVLAAHADRVHVVRMRHEADGSIRTEVFDPDGGLVQTLTATSCDPSLN